VTDDTATGQSWARRLHRRLHKNPVTRLVTKVVVTLVGLAVIAAGVLMLVIPGPGLVAIAIGFGILAIEWPWARRATTWMKEKAKAAAHRTGSNPAQRRRRIVGTSVVGLAAVAVIATYVAFAGWPDFAISGWDWVQGISGVIPELPGM
jgi:uncharacterized protein (TIGR02611 family)